jgi:hypothetical protein
LTNTPNLGIIPNNEEENVKRMAKKNVHTIRGKVYWAKVLGEPVLNYGGDGKEWTMDVAPNDEGKQLLKDLGLGDRLKNKGDDRGDFLAFRQKEKRLDGSFNRRISVSDAEGNPWPHDRLIGNGSDVDVKFEVKDYGKGKFPGLYPQAVRILHHNEYQRQEFAPLSEDDEFYQPSAGTFEGQLPEGMEPPEEEYPE